MLDVAQMEWADIHSLIDDRGVAREDSIKVDLRHGVEFRLLDDCELLVVSCHNSGFGTGQLRIMRDLLRDVVSGHIGPCKFIAFDLKAQAGAAKVAVKPASEFAGFVEELSNLIFQAPILSIAWARGELSGPDLELALACSMIVGEEPARFAFALDLVDSLRTYALLAHKIGFVRAERLMEDGSMLTAAEAHELMLLHAVVPAEPGLDGVRRFAESRRRRHNSACGLHRAQRIAMVRTS